MKNIFKQALKELMNDFDDYDYLLWDMETYLFYKNDYHKYVNDEKFIINFPITHNFLLLIYIINYVWLIEWSSYINVHINERRENKIEKELSVFLNNHVNQKHILYYIVKEYRKAFYEKELNWIENSESEELINTSNALIPIMKFLYKNSDEFK